MTAGRRDNRETWQQGEGITEEHGRKEKGKQRNMAAERRDNRETWQQREGIKEKDGMKPELGRQENEGTTDMAARRKEAERRVDRRRVKVGQTWYEGRQTESGGRTDM